MSEQTVLELIARLDNQTSAGFKAMQKDMPNFYEAEGKAHKTSQASWKKQHEEMAKFKKVAGEAGHIVSDVLQPALSKFGFTAFTVAAAVTAVVKTVNKWADLAEQLHEVAT